MRSFETAADELQPEARREALDMLNEGRIHSANWLPAKVSGLTNPITREISLNPEFVAGNVFEWMPARFGFLIAHELGHVRQFEHWGSAYSTIFATADVLLNRLGPTRGLDRGANAYACRAVRNPSIIRGC